MMNTVKISMFFGLGLLLSSPLAAMNNEMPTLEDNIDAMICIVEKMNTASVNGVRKVIDENSYDLQSTDQEVIANIKEWGRKAGHGGWVSDYMELMKKFSPEHAKIIKEALANNRDIAFNRSYETIQEFVSVVDAFCLENSAVMQDIKKTLLSPNEPSQLEIDIEYELNHQT